MNKLNVDPSLIKEWFEAYEARRKADLIKARDLAYPEHSTHLCIENNVEYFDAMMVSVTVECSCGQSLKIDRDFF